MFTKPVVAVGDRFTKVASLTMPVWKVASIVHQEPLPNHARLEREDRTYDTMTVSIPALTDPHLFKKLPV